jgi:hypothetical protein
MDVRRSTNPGLFTVPMPDIWRLATLLGFGLIGPIALPAGGAERPQAELRRRLVGEPLLTTGSGALRAAPEHRAPVLTQLSQGEPLRVLRTWRCEGGQRWLQVEAASGSGCCEPRRGWLLS